MVSNESNNVRLFTVPVIIASAKRSSQSWSCLNFTFDQVCPKKNSLFYPLKSILHIILEKKKKNKLDFMSLIIENL